MLLTIRSIRVGGLGWFQVLMEITAIWNQLRPQ